MQQTLMCWAVCAVLATVACTVPEGGRHGSLSVPIPPGKGQLLLRWQAESGGRAVLGSAWSASVADAYELVVFGPTGPRAVLLDQVAGQAVALDPGTYRVLVLAGVKRSSGSTAANLVGSGGADSVVIEVGKRTEASLVLRSVDLSLAAAGPAYYKGSVTLTTSGKSRNPWVGMSLAGASTTARPRFKSTEFWAGYKEMGAVTGTPDNWSAEAQALVPASGPSATVQLVGAGLVLQAPDGTWASASGLTGLTWSWPSRPELASTHPLAPLTEVVVPLSAPPTGLQLGLSWE